MIHLKIIVDSGGTFQDIEIVSKPTHIDLKIEEVIQDMGGEEE